METEDQVFFPASIPTPKRAVSPAIGPTPNDPSWGIWEGFGLWIASVLFILIVPTLFLLPYLATINPPIVESEKLVEFAKSDPTAIFLQIVAIIPAHALTILLAWMVVTRFKKFSFRRTLGWETGGFKWWHYCVVLGSFFIIASVVGSFFPEKENDLLRILHSSRSAVYIVAFVATFTAPFVEEVVYRGVLYSAVQQTFRTPIRVLLGRYRLFQRLKVIFVKFNLYNLTVKLIIKVEKLQKEYSIWLAILFVTLIFLFVHVPQYYPSYSTIFLLGLLSLILTSIRAKTNNLLPCIILHTLFNGIQSILLILEPLARTTTVPDPAATILHFFK